MSTRERQIENSEQTRTDPEGNTSVHEDIAQLFGNARKLLDAAGPVTSRVLSSDSERFLGMQRQIGGQ
jgi:hypothetical protein